MSTRDGWQERIKAVELEYKAMRQAADRFLRHSKDDPTILRKDLRHRMIVEASRKLEGTYVIRLFAEFETGVRKYWATIKSTYPRTQVLLDRLASHRKIDAEITKAVHLVRDFRNSLVHERKERPSPVSLEDARGYLCTFFAYLPEEW